MLFFTASLDRMVFLWNMDQELQGKLQQGYMMKSDYKWDFPLTMHLSNEQNEARVEVTKNKLITARNDRIKNDR